MAAEELAEVERAFEGERSTLLEDADAAAAVAATQVQTIEELRTLEASTRRELEKTRREKASETRTNTHLLHYCIVLFVRHPISAQHE